MDNFCLCFCYTLTYLSYLYNMWVPIEKKPQILIQFEVVSAKCRNDWIYFHFHFSICSTLWIFDRYSFIHKITSFRIKSIFLFFKNFVHENIIYFLYIYQMSFRKSSIFLIFSFVKQIFSFKPFSDLSMQYINMSIYCKYLCTFSNNRYCR